MTVTKSIHPVLAVIPARGGSKGLPRKNVLPLMGHPLIAHSIMLARMCPEIDRLVVSTDSEEIAAVARQYGADVINRPSELAQDATSMWPVVQHALLQMEQVDNKRYESLLLLQPTSPGRLPEDIRTCINRLSSLPQADGIVSVSRPDHNPYWYGVIENDGWMVGLIPDSDKITRRQDAPIVYTLNGLVYLWRRSFILTVENWRSGKLLIHEVPEKRALDIDNLEDMRMSDLLFRNGFLDFPWLKKMEIVYRS